MAEWHLPRLNFWPHWLRERDNETPCPVRIWWFIVFLHLLAESGWNAYKLTNFDFAAQVHSWIEYLGAATAAITIKATTEAKPAPKGTSHVASVA